MEVAVSIRHNSIINGYTYGMDTRDYTTVMTDERGIVRADKLIKVLLRLADAPDQNLAEDLRTADVLLRDSVNPDYRRKGKP